MRGIWIGFAMLSLIVGMEAIDATPTYTLAIIKPNAVKKNHIGEIITKLEKGGLRVAALKMQRLTPDQTKKFYAEHKDRSFFGPLTTFMSSGPVVAIALEGENAVKATRDILGTTDPAKAKPGTIRADFGDSLTENAIHGSDSDESARRELAFFFRPDELQQRY